MANTSSPNNIGSFIPTTFIYDVSTILDVEVTSPAFKELLVRLYQSVNNMALVLNMKDTGYYITDREIVCGQIFFPNPALDATTTTTPTMRPVFRKVINFGQLPNNATTSIPHEITVTANTTFTRIYGCASDTTGFTYLPIPYASKVANMIIELNIDATNINIDTGTNRTNYDVCYVVVEYLQT